MRFRSLSGKEIVDVASGTKLGILGQTDLEIDEKTGQIKSFVIPEYKWFGVKSGNEGHRITWNEIIRVGEDMILIQPKKE
ncbi:sporulation protein, YlmC/YmxH family [Thalassobacillus cyri]|uniref:Sporulation protein, YlmC/YmxH family n=1 Tax=Thalassobacillus cyri TaxID=571932 RepID=A0A1H4G0R5_9BACI|nr:YlmC/YmxH family sporulation protein [Thalassobacillus cyri]SEB02508.1 sporulation protein, YlmC/YmxH family [Thalassobacillus cyri]